MVHCDLPFVIRRLAIQSGLDHSQTTPVGDWDKQCDERRCHCPLKWINPPEVTVELSRSTANGVGLHLLKVGGLTGSQSIPMTTTRLTIGRSASNDIVLKEDQTVSREHAAIESLPGGQWRVRDLHSRNGTFVNGLKVSGSAPLRPGDRIEIGSSTLEMADSSGTGAPMTTVAPSTEALGIANLTKREREVVRLIASGKTDLEVSETLVISVNTVRSHLERIQVKLGVRRRTELARLAVRLGLVN